MTDTGQPSDEDELEGMMGSMRGVHTIRTMFREMPDEEPPARGLDALMAAARTKAAEMAPEPEKESWWRRTLAMLTRPPMLAAATVIVLVGSTVVLTRRGGMEAAAPERAGSREREQDLASKQPATGTAKLAARSEAAKGMKDAGEKADDKPDGVAPGPARPVPPRPRPPVLARPEAPTEAVSEPVKVERPPVIVPTDDDEPRIVTEGGEGRQVNGQRVEDMHPPEAPKPVTIDSVTATRPPSPAGGGQDSVPQLVKQAEIAAGRKDCAAVKATAERIRKLDANAYKTRIVTQAAIKRCL